MEKEIRFLCSRRSTLELELILSAFFVDRWGDLGGNEKKDFFRIIQLEDSFLEEVLFKKRTPPSWLNEKLVAEIRSHKIE